MSLDTVCFFHVFAHIEAYEFNSQQLGEFFGKFRLSDSVGPENINDPTGFSGSLIPARDICMAFTSLSIASS